MSQIRVLELKGEGLALGRAHGESLRELIGEFCETAHEIHQENLAGSIDRNDLIELVMKNAWILNRTSPILYQELTGVAQGANRSVSEILLINSVLEIEDLKSPPLNRKLLAREPAGCTSFNIKPRASANHIPILGQTFDMEKYYARFNTVLKIKGPDGRSRLVYTLAGVLGLNGLNSDGLALVINKLVADDSREGVIYPFLVRMALDHSKIGNSIGTLSFAPRASSMCWQVSSAEGVAFCLETTSRSRAYITFRDAQAHTNHFLDPFLRERESPGWLTHGGTFVRLQVTQDYLDDFHGRLDVEGLKELCRNHINQPRSICAHGLPGESDYFSYATIAAVIMEPTNGIMHISGIYPCENIFQTLSL
ncbi:MAG: C45 family peptidase [Deltaproteobacteria bacterium]|jgi:isopenicillin-N N-acyltransferase-like protein|nr:C45 family peptidase [Deltaproteobacteria bacterium]